MLDQSVPYYNVVMKRSAELPVPPRPELPAGYSFAFYSEGKEADWARIEASVGEFDSEADALLYFQKEYMPHREELARRLVFALDSGGSPVATVTAWRNDTDGTSGPSLHWLAVHPGHQGRGLGRALIGKCLELFGGTDPGRDIWLHTQTWSHRAIGLYLQAGFRIAKSESFGGYKNEYGLAEPILREKGIIQDEEENETRTVELPEMKLVGIRIRCPGEEYVRRIPEAFATLKSRLHEIGEPAEPSRQIGAYVAGDYSEEEDGYWACVAVNAVGKVPEGMVALTVPAQKYAAVPHRGPAEEVSNTYENLHGWIEKQGLVRKRRAWHLEISDWGGADLELFDTLEEKTF